MIYKEKTEVTDENESVTMFGGVMSLFDEPLYVPGGNVRGERFANGEVVTKDWLYTYRDRARQVRVLRELLADLSEKRLEPSVMRFEETGNRDALPKGLDAITERFDALQNRYRKELGELLDKQELVEKWMEKLTPREREIVRLRFILGYTILKTSEILGKSDGYVKFHEKRLFS